MLRFSVIGFVIWLLATIAIRLAGQWFFRADEPIWMLLLYVVTAIGVGGLGLRLYRQGQLSSSQQAMAAVALCLPGMCLDILSIAFFATIFPNLPVTYAAAFGAWLMFAYTVMLLTSLMPARAISGQR